MVIRNFPVTVLAVMLLLGGCTLRGRKPQPVVAAPKPAPAPAPTPSGPLSITQTKVELPPEQPLDPRALETTPQAPAPEPEPSPARVPRRPAPSNAGSQAPLPAAPAETPAAPPPQLEERPRLQEVYSAEEKRRLTEEINVRKREINEILQQASRRNLSDADRGIVERVRSFIQLSDQAAGRGELRQADGLSERALVMARELRNAR